MAALRRPLAATLAGLLACAGLVNPARADDEQLWATGRITARLAPGVLLNNETVYRTSVQRGDFDLIDHVQLGYQPTRKVTVWLGYTHQTAMNHGRTVAVEQRLRQQVNVEDVARLGPVRLGGRIRWEQRWRQGQPGTAWRLRPQAKLSLPLPGHLTLTASHEEFLNLNRTSFQSLRGEERMRNAIALSVPLSRQFSAEAGYLQQHMFGTSGPGSDANVMTLGLSATF